MKKEMTRNDEGRGHEGGVIYQVPLLLAGPLGLSISDTRLARGGSRPVPPRPPWKTVTNIPKRGHLKIASNRIKWIDRITPRKLHPSDECPCSPVTRGNCISWMQSKRIQLRQNEEWCTRIHLDAYSIQ